MIPFAATTGGSAAARSKPPLSLTADPRPPSAESMGRRAAAGEGERRRGSDSGVPNSKQARWRVGGSGCTPDREPGELDKAASSLGWSAYNDAFDGAPLATDREGCNGEFHRSPEHWEVTFNCL